jgi:hypothetical protein
MPEVFFGLKSAGSASVSGQGPNGLFQCFLHRGGQGLGGAVFVDQPTGGRHQGGVLVQMVQVALV